MVFRDQRLTCSNCGRPFFFTVSEQRQLAEQQGIEAVILPTLCSQCRPAQPVPTTHPSSAVKPAVVSAAIESVKVESTVEQDDALLREMYELARSDEGFQVKLIGQIKWYNAHKGYGFVTTANHLDIFFHRAGISGKTTQLYDGQQVEFQIHQTDKGWEAFDVSPLPA